MCCQTNLHIFECLFEVFDHRIIVSSDKQSFNLQFLQVFLHFSYDVLFRWRTHLVS